MGKYEEILAKNNYVTYRWHVTIIGLDLAGVEIRPTGFCTLIGMRATTCLIYKDQDILQRVKENNPQVVAIDAPLCLPPGRRTIEEKTSIHLRESDRELLRMGIKLFPITLGPMRKLTQRDIQLKNILEAQKLVIIEAYPGGAQDVLGIPRKQRGIEKLLAGLQKLGIEGLDNSLSDHELDAATCAYVGKLFLEGKAVEYGECNQVIVMPKGRPLKK